MTIQGLSWKIVLIWNTVLLSNVSSFFLVKTTSPASFSTAVPFHNDAFGQCETTTTSPCNRVFQTFHSRNHNTSKGITSMQQRFDSTPRGDSRRIASPSPLYVDLRTGSAAAGSSFDHDDLEQSKNTSLEMSSSPNLVTVNTSSSWMERARTCLGLAADKDGLTLRQRITKMGIFAAMTYNVVSQLNSGTTVSIAWYLFSARHGVSPLAPNQWKSFLAFYAGFWVFNNVVRPIRVATAVAFTPRMEQLTLRVQNHFQLSRTKAITLTAVATYAAACTCSACCFLMASVCSGVPILGR